MLYSQSCTRPPVKMAGDIVCGRILRAISIVRASCDRSPYRGEPRAGAPASSLFISMRLLLRSTQFFFFFCGICAAAL